MARQARSVTETAGSRVDPTWIAERRSSAPRSALSVLDDPAGGLRLRWPTTHPRAVEDPDPGRHAFIGPHAWSSSRGRQWPRGDAVQPRHVQRRSRRRRLMPATRRPQRASSTRLPAGKWDAVLVASAYRAARGETRPPELLSDSVCVRVRNVECFWRTRLRDCERRDLASSAKLQRRGSVREGRRQYLRRSGASGARADGDLGARDQYIEAEKPRSVGPDDNSDRFTYWPAACRAWRRRCSLPIRRRMRSGHRALRDLAAFTLLCIEQRVLRNVQPGLTALYQRASS